MIGWIGSFLLGICAFPEMIRTIKDNRCHVGWGMLLLWFFGEVLVFIHVWNNIHDLALLSNYLLNIILITIMLYYKILR